MEIVLENKKRGCYREILHQIRHIQESTESVVPDVSDDIGKIASVQASVFLKSKDVSSNCVRIGGEAVASVLYITEKEDAVSCVRLSKNFRMEFESGEMDAAAIAQIALQISNVEARVLNPRKISLIFEISGELSAYLADELVIDTLTDSENEAGMHWKRESLEATRLSGVCEKTLAIHEQYSFPEGKAKPVQLVSQRAALQITDTQQVGSKLIVKGNTNLSVCYLAEGLPYPICTEFSSPFSQLVDLGTEEQESCGVRAELTSCYYDLVETIGGGWALDAELHALIQLVSCQSQKISYLSDVYSNRMPAEPEYRRCRIACITPRCFERHPLEERIPLPEDCEDVLCVLSGLYQAAVCPGKLSAVLLVDVIYRNTEGKLACMRRSISGEKDYPDEGLRLTDCRLSLLDARPEGKTLQVQAELEFCLQKNSYTDYGSLCSLKLLEEQPYIPSELPSLTLVRVEQQDLWELARSYHSSTEKILACNGDEWEKLPYVLIPREL